MSTVTYKYLEDFKNENVVLFEGDTMGLNALKDFFIELSKSAIGLKASLNDYKAFQKGNKVDIVIHLVESHPSIKSITNDDVVIIEWNITEYLCNQFAMLINEIAESAKPCHQYLDTDDYGEIVVIVSKGES